MNLPPLIQGLLRPEAFDHPIEELHCRQTHISWIILTGSYAYKIKKPVDFGFLDFTTLEKRRFYCHEELRLNRRLAPQLYLQVCTVTGTLEAPRMNGEGDILEYAVQMRQFKEQEVLSECARSGRLTEVHIEQLAHLVADFHQRIDQAQAGDPYGEPELIQANALHNFDLIQANQIPPSAQSVLGDLKQWTEGHFTRLQTIMKRRKYQGDIRECHGDLHLGNIVLWEGKPLPFDCIEFNPDLRWIDVMSEIAFTLMDLCARDLSPLGFLFLNQYLSQTGDYAGVTLLRYYLIYRAIVRAKIAFLTVQETNEDKDWQDFQRYLDLAWQFTQTKPPVLYITHGFSGSGKSFASRKLAMHLGALHLRSDVERKRLAGMAAWANSKGSLAQNIYSPELTRRTYERLKQIAMQILNAGFPVIVDATFLQRQYRDEFRQLALKLKIPFKILNFQAGKAVMEARIRNRLTSRQDPSEANLEVLEYQLAHHDPLAKHEQWAAVTLDTSAGFNLEAALSSLRNL